MLLYKKIGEANSVFHTPYPDPAPKKCGGGCERELGGHRGEVKFVHVYDANVDWGNFWYCEAAIECDKERGFTVEEVKEST